MGGLRQVGRSFVWVLAAAFLAFPPARLAAQAPPSAAQAAPVQADPRANGAWYWRGFARVDLRAIHDRIRDNSPLMHVARDSADMRRWLEEGFQRASAMLPLVTDETAYRYLIDYYVSGFRDGHIAALPQDLYHPPNLQARGWPGISTMWRNGHYLVSFVAPWVAGGPAAGDELLGCDGQSAEALARSRLDLFYGDLDQPLQRRASAFLLLWDRSNPFVDLPRTCRFRGVHGHIVTTLLEFRPLAAGELRSAWSDGPWTMANPPALDVTRWEGHGWWIGVPRLSDDLDWAAFFATVRENLDAIRAAPVVVIDVRGNSGGSSLRADRLAEMLWGEALMAARRPALGPRLWRATPYVRDSLLGRLDLWRETGAESELVAITRAEISGVERAIATDETFYSEPSETPRPVGSAISNPMHARVVLLTDERCFSACLDLMDLFMAMPGVEQAGLPTGSDTIFMELGGRAVLPSGRYFLVMGIKAWPERPRGSNIPYAPPPALLYRGDQADEAEWRGWLARALVSRRQVPVDEESR